MSKDKILKKLNNACSQCYKGDCSAVEEVVLKALTTMRDSTLEEFVKEVCDKYLYADEYLPKDMGRKIKVKSVKVWGNDKEQHTFVELGNPKKTLKELEEILDFIDSYCRALTDGKHGLDSPNRAEIKAMFKKLYSQFTDKVIGGMERKSKEKDATDMLRNKLVEDRNRLRKTQKERKEKLLK